MKGIDYIKKKQILWAERHNIPLIGSKGTRGFHAYTNDLNENLFEPLMPEVSDEIKKGNGGELIGNHPKINAVHSSAALALNLFQYWKRINEIYVIAHCCGLCDKGNKKQIDIKFEQKFEINKVFRIPPNIDVVIENSKDSQFKVFAIECKFTEPYSTYQHGGIDPKYFDDEKMPLWEDSPNLQKLAESISPTDAEFKYLHRAQLIKHILGLKNKYKKKSFKLLYLWYDTLGDDGYIHREQINKFADIAKADNVNFHSKSYQEVIRCLYDNYYQSHKDYLNYISGRYF